MEGEKEREKKEQLIFGQRNSYQKYSLVERGELALNVKEYKQEYVSKLVSKLFDGEEMELVVE